MLGDISMTSSVSQLYGYESLAHMAPIAAARSAAAINSSQPQTLYEGQTMYLPVGARQFNWSHAQQTKAGSTLRIPNLPSRLHKLLFPPYYAVPGENSIINAMTTTWNAPVSPPDVTGRRTWRSRTSASPHREQFRVWD